MLNNQIGYNVLGWIVLILMGWIVLILNQYNSQS